MGNTIKLSIIVPVYNAEKYIDKCIKSLCEQTLREIEIILINDQSTDNSLNILNEYASKDHRIIVKSLEKNSGCNIARNYGITISNGKYIGFVDSDDFISNTYFEELYKTAMKSDCDIVATDQVYVLNKYYNNSGIKNTGIAKDAKFIETINDKGKIIIETGITWNKIYKTDFVKKNNIKFYETKMAGGDNCFTTFAVIYANKIAITHDAKYYYVQNNESIVHKTKDCRSFSIIDMYNYIEKNIKQLSTTEKKEWLKIINKRRKKDFLTFKKMMKEEYIKKFTKLTKNEIYKVSILQKMFSIRNEDNFYKVIRIFGVKFKIRQTKKEIKFLTKKINLLNGKFSEINKINNFIKENGINKEKILCEIENFDEYGITQEKREQKIIVSLTSYPDRMYDIHYCLYSLLNQSVKPDEVILWLAKEQFTRGTKDIPLKTLKLQKNGLTIKWCEDIKSYKKLIPTLKDYPEDIIITADDDIFYDKYCIENLYNSYLNSDKKTIIANRCHTIYFDNDGNLKPYKNWKKCIEDHYAKYTNFATGAGGILYPAHTLYKDVFNSELFMELAPNADDIWFWAMALLNGTKIKISDTLMNKLKYINPQRELNINDDGTLYSSNGCGGNDEQMKNILLYYPHIRDILNNENINMIF